MDSVHKGRYRPGRRRRGHVTRRAVAVLILPVVAFTVANTVVSPPEGAVPRAADGLIEGAAGRDDNPSRSTDRDDNETAPGGVAGGGPAANATVIGPVVNGRTQPPRVDPPRSAEGTYTVAGGTAEGIGDREHVIRYLVEVEDGLPFDKQTFADEVHRILNDPRGWGPANGAVFERVESGDVRFRVALSSPSLTDTQCFPLLTRGRVSCWNGSRAVINALRWGTGSPTFGDDLLTYREYLINHEVGHALGHAHENCPDDGEPAPVMVQQTKSLEGCEPNPWPELDP